MATSLKIVLHTKTYGDGTRPVMLQCITTSPVGNTWKRRTLCRARPDQFDKASGRIKKNHPCHILLNSQLAKAYHEAETRLLTWQLQNKPIDAAAVIAPEGVPVQLKAAFLAYGREYVERCRLKGQSHTADKYTGHLTKLAEYLDKKANGDQKDVLMDEVTEDWILTWSVWLRSNGTRSENTLHRRMAFVRTLFNDARKRKLTTNDPMAFLVFKEQPVRKPKLTLDQIRRLEEAVLSGREADARNTFLLQFYAYGSRISDALTWKKENVRREGNALNLEYTSIKTGRLISVRLNPDAMALVDHYLTSVPGPFLLPWLAGFVDLPTLSDQENRIRLTKQISSKTSIINALLKGLAGRLDFPLLLTSHIARHTFATLADSRVTDKRKISAALGHARFSTTEVYLSELHQDQVNDAMSALWTY